MERVFTVYYLSLKNCFCCFSSNSTKDLPPGQPVIIKYGSNKSAHLSVGPPLPEVPDYAIGINSLFAKLLGINENENVIVVENRKLPSITRLTISPIKKEDFLVMELLTEEIQSTLLNQLSIINKNQSFIIWIGSEMSVPVHAKDIFPVSPGYLDNMTEVVIMPFENVSNYDIQSNYLNEKVDSRATADLEESSTGASNEAPNPFTAAFNFKHENEPSNETKFKQIEKYFATKNSLIRRLVPYKSLQSTSIQNYLYQFNVFVFKESLPWKWCQKNSFEEPIICSLNLLNRPEVEPIDTTLFVRLHILDIDTFDLEAILFESIFVDDSLFAIFNCEISSKAILNPVTQNYMVNEIEIYANPNHFINYEDLLKDYLAEHCKREEVVLNPEVQICLREDVYCTLKFLPAISKFCIVDQEFLRNCKFRAIDGVVIEQPKLRITASDVLECVDINGYSNIIDECLAHLKANLIDGFNLDNFLIEGKAGTGKSTIINKIRSLLSSSPFYVYSEVIGCKNLKGKTMDSLYKIIITAFGNLVYHQPSMLFIDDLHVLCENINEGDASGQNAIHYNRISEMLCTVFTTYTAHNRIGIIATTQAIHKLNKNIYSTRGLCLFKNISTIPPLSKTDRILILKYCSSLYNTFDIDFEDLSQKTEGFVIQDLVDFTNKVIFQASKDAHDDDIDINEEHCEKALKNMTILSLENVKLHSPGDKDFSDVGGMSEIKELLVENLLWPAKYPNIYSDAPLRLQSGLLLYGPPGTGKTLLAGAAAKQCDIRLIAVKGPELLSKYIGASEQAVRDVFQKAQSAKPCILFFDEFDSLAPRRGHDSTGVTDRVVNQLLTQLDGVESLSGVCVLAATSRPDLLDPALLRPGRLDKQFLCPLPDRTARLEILKVLSKSLDMDADVDLDEIARETDGFSGADLQSLLYTAQLSTVEHLLLEDKKDCPPKELTQSTLEDALKKTRPSLTKEEKAKYESIYATFNGSANALGSRPGTKATLA